MPKIGSEELALVITATPPAPIIIILLYYIVSLSVLHSALSSAKDISERLVLLDSLNYLI